MGKNNGGNGSICPDCQNHLIPVKLYAPEILRMFSGGHKEFSRLGILVDYRVCLNSMCPTGKGNIESHERIVDSGMIRME